MTQEETDMNRVCNIIEHLARYRMAMDITNKKPTAAFAESFAVRIEANETLLGPGEQISLQYKSPIKITMENFGSTALYFYLYNLGPCWRVKGMLNATYETIPGHRKSSRKIQMTVPPVMSEHGSCEDVIKVFVTSEPTSFDSLELPNLDELDKTSGARVGRPNSNGPEDWVALNFPIHTFI